MTDRPQFEDEPGAEERFERAVKNALRIPPKPHAKKSLTKSTDQKRRQGWKSALTSFHPAGSALFALHRVSDGLKLSRARSAHGFSLRDELAIASVPTNLACRISRHVITSFPGP